MFKLTVVNGVNRGESFDLKEGDNYAGRTNASDIVLESKKVSKKHVVFSVAGSLVTVKDAGSSNGTFVNGVLVKSKSIKPGDRISIGEFVLELILVKQSQQVIANNVVSLSSHGVPLAGGTHGNLPHVAGMGGNPVTPITGMTDAPQQANGTSPGEKLPPTNFGEKLKFYFEKYVINFVYNLNEKHEWRVLFVGMISFLTLGAVLLAVFPVIDRVQDKLAQEAKHRAFLLARQMNTVNSRYIFEKQPSKVDIAFAENEKGVLGAYIVDMDGRVLAPNRMVNQNLADSQEAAFGASSRSLFIEREKLEKRAKFYESTVAVAVPLRIFNPGTGKNITVALSLVFFDSNQVVLDSGTVALVYIQSAIFASILGVLVFFSLYRLTLRPLQHLNAGVDQFLKGNASVVEAKYKMEEINPLIDVVNAALQRVPSGGGKQSDFSESGSIDEMVNGLRFVADHSYGTGVIIFSPEQRVLHMNPYMEEVTGIRAAQAVGDEVSNVARDGAFASFIQDLIARAPVGGAETITEDYEFSGVVYSMECCGLGQPGIPKLYLVTAVGAQ